MTRIFPAPRNFARIGRAHLLPVRSRIPGSRLDWTARRHPYFRHKCAGTIVYLDRSDDGDSKPRLLMRKAREALRFASIASHNLPCRELFAQRFSEGVWDQPAPKTLFLYSLTAISGIRRAHRRNKTQV